MQTLDAIIAPFTGMTFDQLKPVAKSLGIPHGTLYRVVKGYTKNPRYRTLEKMAAFSATGKALPDSPTERPVSLPS